MKIILASILLFASPPSFAAETGLGIMLAEVTGSVWTRTSPTASWESAKDGTMLAPGGETRTGRGSGTVLSFSNGNKVRLGAATIFGVEDASPAKTALRLVSGKIQAWVKKANNANFSVRHSAGVAAVRGTVFGIEALTGGSVTISLFEGALDVVDNFGRPTVMSPGQNAQLTQQGGMQGVTALPPDAKMPEEPNVEAPPAPKTADAPKPAPAPESTTVDADKPADGDPAPAPAASPVQETKTVPVSPSAP